MKILMKALILSVAALTFIPIAYAEEITAPVEFHGFGGWAYEQTDGNQFLGGSKDGNYDNFQFALAVAARPAQNLRINGQFRWEEENNEQAAEIDYAFAEWFFADALIFRVGKVKQPLGIYTETYDVGTMRPFFYLPRSTYGPSGAITKSYRGIGFTGSLFTETGWGVEYDLYGGSLDMDYLVPFHLTAILTPMSEWSTDTQLPEGVTPFQLFEQLFSMPTGVKTKGTIKDMVGGRVVGHTPFNLNLGVSARTGKFTELSGEMGSLVTELFSANEFQTTLFNAQLEYIYKIATFRGEYIYAYNQAKTDVSNGAYGELSIRPLKHWEIAGRYDWLKFDFDYPGLNFSHCKSLLKHEEWAAGINYWFNSNMVIKLSYHHINGNRYALPETMEKAVNGLKTKTDMVIAGSQFSF